MKIAFSTKDAFFVIPDSLNVVILPSFGAYSSTLDLYISAESVAIVTMISSLVISKYFAVCDCRNHIADPEIPIKCRSLRIFLSMPTDIK